MKLKTDIDIFGYPSFSCLMVRERDNMVALDQRDMNLLSFIFLGGSA